MNKKKIIVLLCLLLLGCVLLYGGYLLSADKIGKLTTGYYFDDQALTRSQIAAAFTAMLFELGLIAALLHNLRERKKITLELKQERDLLELRVEERTVELKDSEIFISSVLDSLTSHIAVLDNEGIIISVNHAWRQFAVENGLPEHKQYNLGQSYFEACQKSYDGAHLDEAITVQNGIMAVLAGTRDEFHFEYSCHAPNVERWFFMRVFPLKYGGKKGVVVSHENITERKQLEKQLRESKDFFETLTTITPIGIYQTDAEGKCIFANQKCCDITGLTQQQLLNDGWSAAIFPDDKEKVYQEWYAAIQQQRQFNLESRFQQSNGQIIWGYGVSQAIHDEQGNIRGYIGTIVDITERKQAEQRLQEITARFEGFAKASRYGFGMADLQGNITYANHALADLLGEKTPENCLGKNFISNYYSPAIQEKLKTQVLPALLETGHWHGEL